MFNLVEDLGNNVTRHWNADKSVVKFKFLESSRSTVAIYFKAAMETFIEWDASKPIYMIQDISDGNINLTPYLKGRINQLSDYTKEENKELNIAIVLQNNFSGTVIRSFGQLMSTNSGSLQQAFFTNMDEAEEWIKTQQKQV